MRNNMSYIVLTIGILAVLISIVLACAEPVNAVKKIDTTYLGQVGTSNSYVYRFHDEGATCWVVVGSGGIDCIPDKDLER